MTKHKNRHSHSSVRGLPTCHSVTATHIFQNQQRGEAITSLCRRYGCLALMCFIGSVSRITRGTKIFLLEGDGEDTKTQTVKKRLFCMSQRHCHPHFPKSVVRGRERFCLQMLLLHCPDDLIDKTLEKRGAQRPCRHKVKAQAKKTRS
jgi:hypothetical protein